MAIATEKTIPIRAANNFGPELTKCFSSLSTEIMNFDILASGLYLDSSSPRSKKSTNKIIMGRMLPVTKKLIKNKTVIPAFERATFSLIECEDIGQKAFEFIM